MGDSCRNTGMDTLFLNRLREWDRRAERTGKAQFSPFLNLEEQSALQSVKREFLSAVTLFGGCDGCERVMARFGEDTPFPIVCLHIRPVNKKFASPLTHRDFLGALMNLGIERGVVGDIVVRDREAYVFMQEHTAPFAEENLSRVGQVSVVCRRTDELPEGTLFQTAEETAAVASLRIDCLMAAVFDLSRARCADLLTAQKVFINGALCENHSCIAKPDDIVSVRGQGRFRFLGEAGQTRKGRLRVRVERYI